MSIEKDIYSLQAEQAVLGSLMLDNNCLEKVKHLISKDDFFDKRNKELFCIITNLAEANKPFDMVTIPNVLKNSDSSKTIEDELYIYNIAKDTPTADNILAYVDILKEHTRRRAIMAAVKEVGENITNGIDSYEIIRSLNEKTKGISISAIVRLNLDEACVSYQDLITSSLPEREFILPWLPAGGLAMVYAERGLGKTFFALSLSYAVASTSYFMKWKILKNISCLYIDGEMSRAEMKERAGKIFISQPVREWMLLSHENFFDKFERDLGITDFETQNAILKLVDKNKFGLVVMDNLSSLSRIREDKSDDWREVMLPFLIACRRRGVAVLLVHHAAKSGDQRGTGAREDALDTTIKLSRIEGGDDHDGAYFRIDFTKTRSCFGLDVVPVVAKLMKNAYGGLVWDVANAEQNTKNQMLEIITSSGADGVSARDIAEELKISEPMVSKYRTQLIKDGLIESSKGKRPLKAIMHYN